MKWSSLFNWGKAEEAIAEVKKASKRQLALYMADRARQYVPVDTGDLFRSITIVAASGSDTAHVIATMSYAQWVEFGHIAGSSTWVAPNPFMRRALADTAKAFPDTMKDIKMRRPGGESGAENMGITFSVDT